MLSPETASPSLLKPALMFVATAAMLALSSPAPTQPLSQAPRAYAGDPSVRIRGIDPHGLDRATFAAWLAVHHASMPDSHAVALFIEADADRDGRLSPAELKDVLLGRADAGPRPPRLAVRPSP